MLNYFNLVITLFSNITIMTIATVKLKLDFVLLKYPTAVAYSFIF